MIIISASIPAKTFGLAKRQPVGCKIARASKPGLINEGFHKDYRMAEHGFPVSAEAPEIEG